jgi:hypothetical protein
MNARNAPAKACHPPAGGPTACKPTNAHGHFGLAPLHKPIYLTKRIIPQSIIAKSLSSLFRKKKKFKKPNENEFNFINPPHKLQWSN